MGWVIGVDEVGRGALAGEVLTAGVLVERPTSGSYPVIGVRDSKQLSPAKREALSTQLLRCETIKSVTASRSAEAVDQKGIVAALGECFRECVTRLLKVREVDAVLVDGDPLWSPAYLTGNQGVEVHFIQKGDQKEWVIGAASILAKVERDRQMVSLSSAFPEYGWNRNMGYGTEEHIQAIRAKGLTPSHRRTFCKDFTSEKDDSLFDMFGSAP